MQFLKQTRVLEAEWLYPNKSCSDPGKGNPCDFFENPDLNPRIQERFGGFGIVRHQRIRTQRKPGKERTAPSSCS